jgi:flavin-dependent dehydrogenase
MSEQPQPVIVGSGLTGMAISRTLANARVPHVLVGGPPGTLPRLGESLNLEGTIGLWELFPELSRFYYPKKVVTGYLGDRVIECDFDTDAKRISRVIFGALGYRAVPEFLQFDRLGFDAALWEATAANEYCTVVDQKVAALEYDAGRDAFSAVRLADGSEIRPGYLFDASNHGRLLGKAAGLEHRTIGEPQRVAFTHYHAAPGTPLNTEPWEVATVIVRLFRDDWGVDAIAWCIPLGSYVSIGISLLAAESDLPNDELLELAGRAFERYGVHYRRRFTTAAPIQSLDHQYFIYDRAYGGNWLLAGPSFCQVWWMAGAGVGTAFAAAQVAPDVVRDPLGAGRRYDDYIKVLEGIHYTFEYFASTPREEVTPELLHRASDRFVVTNLVRLARSTKLRPGRLPRLLAKPLEWAFTRPQTFNGYCRVDWAPPAPAARPARELAGAEA